MESEPTDRLRALPPAHALLESEPARSLAALQPAPAVRAAVRRVLDTLRAALLAGDAPADRAALTERAVALLAREAARAARPRLARVINATGVVLHTNLGRAPLSDEVLAHVAEVAKGYATLEYDLAAGRRGHRDRLVSELCAQLVEAEDALVVNNCAAAVLITATALAAGREVVVSRGELVEIGGGFRVPDILASCGARLVEVGTTNRTRLADYERAITPATAMLLKVHRSNFALVGFTLDTDARELTALGRARGVPVVEDLGSGAMLDTAELHPGLEHEPTPREAIAAGVDLVMFSGDKLLGGPQAGIIAGRAALIDQLRRHPLARATRPGRLVFAALEATLRAYAAGRARTAIPVVAMLAAEPAELRARAEALCAATRSLLAEGSGNGAGHALAVALAVEPTEGRVGGGAMPRGVLASWGVTVRAASEAHAGAIEQALRAEGAPPVIARVAAGRVVLDVRTVGEAEVLPAARGLAQALRKTQEMLVVGERTPTPRASVSAPPGGRPISGPGDESADDDA